MVCNNECKHYVVMLRKKIVWLQWFVDSVNEHSTKYFIKLFLLNYSC